MNQIRATYEFLRGRSKDYLLTFKHNTSGQRVLADLAKFCRADRPTWSEDPRHHARLEGRREVWLRIEQHLRLTPEQLYEIFSGHNFNPQDMDTEEDE